MLPISGSLMASQVLLTIVDPDKLQIRVDLPEEHLSVVKEGSECAVTFAARPDLRAKGVVKSVSLVPYAGTKYDCVVLLKGAKKAEGLVPTMTCQLEFADAN